MTLILLLAPTVTALQTLLAACEGELTSLDMQLNFNKSSCIRFGPRFDANCECLISVQGGLLPWTNRCKYLGVYFTLTNDDDLLRLRSEIPVTHRISRIVRKTLFRYRIWNPQGVHS